MSGCGDYDPEELCPRTEDFHAESELGLDLVEGCRVLISKVWQKPNTNNQLWFTQAINLGTYSVLVPQQQILQSLLHNQPIKQGGRSWSSIIQYLSGLESPGSEKEGRLSVPGEKSVIARFASTNRQLTLRGSWKLNKWNFSAAWVTGQPLAILKKYAPSRFQDHTLFDNPMANEDIGVLKVERETPRSHTGVKLTMQPGTPVVGLTYSARALARKMWAGADWSYSLTTGAVLSTLAVKKQLSDALTCTVSIGSEPNFEKPMDEGLNERVFQSRTSFIYKYSSNLRWVANLQTKLGPSDPIVQPVTEKSSIDQPTLGSAYSFMSMQKRLTGLTRISDCIFSAGYDLTLTKIRLMAELNTAGQLKSVVQTANGFVYSGQIDYPNDNYKFGFGCENFF